MSGVLKDNVAGLELLHLGTLCQEAGDADQVALGAVEREILVVDGECGLDHVNDSVWVALSSRLSWEDVGDTAVEEAVHACTVANVVVEICRLVANLDADTWGNALLVGEASLCVQGEVAAKDLGVDGVKAVDLVGNLDHDLIGQLVGLVILAVSAAAIKVQQLSDALAHAGNAKHAAEALARNEAFLSQEAGLKEVGILNHKADALVHEVQDLAGCGWQQVVHEVVNVGCKFCKAREKYAAQSVSAAAHRKDVIAAYDGVLARVGLFVDAVVSKSRVGADHGGLDGKAHEFVGRDLWIVLESEVWNGVHELAVNLKQQSTCASVLWTNVCMAVTTCNGAVDVVQEAAQTRLNLSVGHALQEWVNNLVQLANIDRAAGDGRNVVVKSGKAPE